MGAARKKHMVDTTYNGWTNRETWCVSLWLENEEGSYRYWQGRAKDAKREAKTDRYADAKGLLAAWLKAELEESAPELGATLWSDLLSTALSGVEWHEIAEHLLEE